MQIPKTNSANVNQLNGPSLLEQKISQVANFYESEFVKMMTQEMRKNSEGSIINGGNGEKIFQDMLDDEYAQEVPINPKSRLGIADLIENDLREKVGLPKKVKQLYSNN